MGRFRTLPPEPATGDFSILTKEEKNCLNYWVAFGSSKDFAFKLFLKEKKGLDSASPSLLRRATQQFFESAIAIKYTEAYKAELSGENEKARKEETKEERDQKRLKSLNKVVDYVVENINHIDEFDDPTVLLKLADKVGFFGDGDERLEAPRRYLPATCSRCRMRLFVEQAKREEKLIDDCDYCKYKKRCNDEGVSYSDKDMLDIPDVVIEKKGLKHYEVIDSEEED
jgi:hypothetical protein